MRPTVDAGDPAGLLRHSLLIDLINVGLERRPEASVDEMQKFNAPGGVEVAKHVVLLELAHDFVTHLVCGLGLRIWRLGTKV